MLVALMDAFWLLAFAAALGTWSSRAQSDSKGASARAADSAGVAAGVNAVTVALSVATATIAFGLIAWITPNLLSIWNALTTPAVAFVWLVAALALALSCWGRIVRGWVYAATAASRIVGTWRQAKQSEVDEQGSRRERAVGLAWGIAVATLLVLTFASATLYPPTVWDSHSHHLPRLVQFIQNQTVAPFPTYYPSMNSTYPFTAYLNAQTALLWGTTDILNLIQWLAYVGSAVMVFAITKLLGGGRAAARISTLVALSAPSVALQASSTQYDLVTALWCLIAILLVLVLRSHAGEERPPLALAVLLGAALGLGAVTKITFIALLIPFCVWLSISFFRSAGYKRTLGLGSVTLLVLALVVVPWFGMNVSQGGNALGTSSAGNIHMAAPDRSAGALWTNMVRNLSMQLATPVAPVNRAIEHGAALVAAPLGVPIDSPANKEDFDRTYELPTWTFSPDMASSPVTALLMVVSVFALVAGARRSGDRAPLIYAACAVAGAAAIAASVTWNPFITRSLGTAILVASPLAGLGLNRIAGSTETRSALRGAVVGGLLVVAVAFALLAVVFNASAPLVSRSVFFGGNWNGYWNLPYQERGWGVELPFIRPDVAAVRDIAEDVARTSVTQGWSTGAGIPLFALIGGEAGDHMPAYPLIRELQDAGFTVRYESRFGPSEVPGTSEELTGATPALILSYDFKDSPGTAIIGATSAIDNPSYRVVYQRYSPELETMLTVLVYEALEGEDGP